tara:strand:+ start:2793 stop:4280 length:1488 start_codon:yes stop_codon:yes gene_type:complete
MDRRRFLTVSAAALATPSLVGTRAAARSVAGQPLPIPPILDASGRADAPLEAIAGTVDFGMGGKAQTLGYSQPYLGPVLRMRRGEIARPVLKNRLNFAVTAHWHGAHVPGAVDGGPQLALAPGKTWAPELEIDQPAATLWYHSHIHGETGPQVYRGLSGMLIVDDPDATNPGLPSSWGVDDIPVIIQDRLFDRSGDLVYGLDMPTVMHGLHGGTILANGAVRPNASVARGLVRLRLLNGSNARIYTLKFEDGRRFHQIASDGGLLPAPTMRDSLVLAPAERAEIVVDLSDGAAVRLVSLPDTNGPMGGMMRGGMGGMMGGGDSAAPEAITADGAFGVLDLTPDKAAPAGQALAQSLAGGPTPITGDPVRRRQVALQMGPMAMRGSGNPLAINGRAYDMGRIDFDVPRGEVELWEVTSDMMAHPFHVHGTSFTVLSENGKTVPFQQRGTKDVLLVDGSAEILVRFDKPATRETPYMFHCHILEHEDGGMMGQFTVT